MLSTLAYIADELEIDAGITTPANPTESGYYKRWALALEELAGVTNTGSWLRRAALAAEEIAGTDGSAENRNEAGYLKRIADAMEVEAGVGTGNTWLERIRQAVGDFTGGGGGGPAYLEHPGASGTLNAPSWQPEVDAFTFPMAVWTPPYAGWQADRTVVTRRVGTDPRMRIEDLVSQWRGTFSDAELATGEVDGVGDGGTYVGTPMADLPDPSPGFYYVDGWAEKGDEFSDPGETAVSALSSMLIYNGVEDSTPTFDIDEITGVDPDEDIDSAVVTPTSFNMPVAYTADAPGISISDDGVVFDPPSTSGTFYPGQSFIAHAHSGPDEFDEVEQDVTIGGVTQTFRVVTVAPDLILTFTGGSLAAGVTLTRASTGRYFNSSGVLSSAAVDVARLSYLPTGYTVSALLVEPAATNLLLRSEEFDNASWTKSNVTITANNAAAPDGNTTMDKMVENSSNGQHNVEQTIAATGSGAFSFHAKRSGRDVYARIWRSSTSWLAVVFDLVNGVVSQTSQGSANTFSAITTGMLNYGASSIYRCWVVFTTGSTSTQGYNIHLTNTLTPTLGAHGVVSYTGDNASGAWIWGAQYVSGATKLTSYIPTTTASAARSADVASYTVPSGRTSIRYTFDDDTTQDVAVSSGAYNIPTNLNRNAIKQMQVF